MTERGQIFLLTGLLPRWAQEPWLGQAKATNQNPTLVPYMPGGILVTQAVYHCLASPVIRKLGQKWNGQDLQAEACCAVHNASHGAGIFKLAKLFRFSELQFSLLGHYYFSYNFIKTPVLAFTLLFSRPPNKLS